MTAEAAFNMIEARRQRPWANEEEVRLAWISALEQATGLIFDAERARRDSSYNNVVIEFKAPGYFHGRKSSPRFIEATRDRLAPYIRKIAASQNAAPEDFIGIAIDGEHVCFVKVTHDGFESQHLLPFSVYAVEMVLQAVMARTRKPISSPSLLRDFGPGSATARSLMQGLSDALAAHLIADGSTKIHMMFEEWRSLYGQVADTSVVKLAAIERELAIGWKGPKHLSIPGRLFVLHSYNSLIIKLLAAEITTGHGLTATQQFAQELASLPKDQDLLDRLRHDIEGSALFTQAGLESFVEEAIFSWYLDVAEDPAHGSAILAPLRTILSALSLYHTDRIGQSRDVLRDLYQGLVPGALRQSLGEFYTPDWLVDHTIARADQDGWLGKRVLDPTCGSGSFLIGALRQMKREAAEAGWPAARTLDQLTAALWGFDLNPLAVQTARVNYLMEIADLLQEAPGHRVELPVLLADAIYAPVIPEPVADSADAQIVSYQIGSHLARLNVTIPATLVRDRHRLDDILSSMAECVEDKSTFDTCSNRLISLGYASNEEMAIWHPSLRHTYEQVLSLHQRAWDGIWFRIIRNFFWSAAAGRFDVVLGNPPWVRWSKLPDAYRQRVKPTCEHYGIFSRSKRHGGNELDISAMITYSVADKWLRNGGRIAFVITGTLFKNPSSAGFRTFELTPNAPTTQHLVPRLVDDMRSLKPFEDASNHTTVAIFDKLPDPGHYPLPWYSWSASEGTTRAIPPSMSLENVQNRTILTQMEAAPVGEQGSPWAVLVPGRHAALQALAQECDWTTGRKGITTDLNGVYFVTPLDHRPGQVKVQSRPESGNKDIGAARTAWVEDQLLYPLIKGAKDFEPFYLRLDAPGLQPLMAFVPNEGISAADYKAADLALNGKDLPLSKDWFKPFRNLLEQRSTWRRQMHGAPPFAIYNVGRYSFAPWKVIWPEISSRFHAAVAGQGVMPDGSFKPYVPDHKIYFAAFDTPEPAHYLCALLNAPMVREWIEAHNVSIQMGNVFKHLTLPEFDENNQEHQEIARLSSTAHATHSKMDRTALIAKIAARTEALLQDWVQAQS